MNTRVVDSSTTCLKLGALAFAIALTLRGGIAAAQETAPEGVERSSSRPIRFASFRTSQRVLVRL